MMNKLYELDNYLCGIPFIFSSFIREYDISKANISILLYNNLISKEEYKYLYSLPKFDRQYIIGNILKNKKLSQEFDNGLIIARKLFFDANNIQDYEVLSIKKDAVFLINKIANVTNFGVIEFKNKNTYSSYLLLNKHTEVLYGTIKDFETQNDKILIDVKGINDEKVEKYHTNGFLDILLSIFYYVENIGIKEAITYIRDIYNKYVKLELPLEYYREFNADSMYLLKPMPFSGNMKVPHIFEENKDLININYNLQLLREIFGYLSNIYFNNKK